MVQFFIDNAAFMQSGAKGRSRANRLNDLLRELFGLMIKFGFVIMWTWIATDDNVNADHLSRGRVAEFFRTVYETGVWTEATVPEPMPDVGRTRTLPEGRAAWRAASRRRDSLRRRRRRRTGVTMSPTR